jgi:hypothetical protein
MRWLRRAVTIWPVCVPISVRTSAGPASLWVPFPRAMNESWNGRRSMLPRIFTRPRLPTYSAEPGLTRYVQPPWCGLLRGMAVKALSRAVIGGRCT